MLLDPDALLVLLVALAADALVGDPDPVWRRLPHPVTWMGNAIAWLDISLNREEHSAFRRRLLGVVALIMLLAVGLLAGAAIDAGLRSLPGHPWISGLLASVLIAQNSLYTHVARIRDAFASGGLVAARRAVSMVVGRDPEALDEAGVCRAAIETTAENFSDGVVAPAFWMALLGWPGLVAYKVVNTADSMIGHRNARHADFGWASARFDDLVNLVPARLSGVLLALAAPLGGGSPRTALRVMLRDAGRHRSPNAGWPEAAMAGALGVALAGPRRYPGYTVDDPFLNADGRTAATPADIRAALRILAGGCGALAAGVGLLWLLSRGG